MLLIAVMAAAGHGAASGSQTVTVSAVQAIDITVPAAESIASTPPGSCGTTSTTVNVKSNKYWNLQVRSEPTNYANGKAKNGSSTEMVNAFPYRRGGAGSFINITSSFGPILFGLGSQTKTNGRDVTIDYQHCVDWLDDAGSYTIVVEYLGYQPQG